MTLRPLTSAFLGLALAAMLTYGLQFTQTGLVAVPSLQADRLSSTSPAETGAKAVSPGAIALDQGSLAAVVSGGFALNALFLIFSLSIVAALGVFILLSRHLIGSRKA